MNKKLIYAILITIILVVIVVAGVSLLLVKTQENIIDTNLDSTFQLKINQTAIIKSENLKIKFVNVTEDSRCPSKILCFMAGKVTVVINISKNGQNLGNFNLTLPGENPDLDFVTENINNFDGYSIKLIKIDPYPESPDEKIKPSDYVGTFIVSKKTFTFTCQSGSDCVIKDGQCGPGCYHKNQEPEINPEITCEYRPWFKQEKCECVNNKCTKITCEDLGLDYPECNQ